ncbi:MULTISPECIES: hypothetical protein [unclassified Mesorhizobium]|nr:MULTISPECIES: hypothetical protein [unclassified Mesorhizobium]
MKGDLCVLALLEIHLDERAGDHFQLLVHGGITPSTNMVEA